MMVRLRTMKVWSANTKEQRGKLYPSPSLVYPSRMSSSQFEVQYHRCPRFWYPNKSTFCSPHCVKQIMNHQKYWLKATQRSPSIYPTPSSRNVVALGECSAGATKARPTATCEWKEHLSPKDPCVYLSALFVVLSLSLCLYICIK